jgi:hypothetical protein
MKVYALIHGEDDWDWSSTEVRDIYTTPELAEADKHTSRVPDGPTRKGEKRQMKTVDAGCCEVEEFEVKGGTDA